MAILKGNVAAKVSVCICLTLVVDQVTTDPRFLSNFNKFARNLIIVIMNKEDTMENF